MIDLLLVGPDSDNSPRWPLGRILRAGTSPVRALREWLSSSPGVAVLCWDPRLGSPDSELVARLVQGRGDVWHAGLKLGTAGQPGLIDFVAPNWMFACDPLADREATSWRVSASACLIRTSVLQQLGAPCEDFDTVAGAFYEWGHRSIARGALMRHVPALVAHVPQDVVGSHRPTITDEVRLVAYRYGRWWARWATGRAVLTGYADAGAVVRAWQQIPARRPYSEPAGYVTDRSLGTPDLAKARVTVLIPTLHRYPYLRVVLEDLRAQTVRPHEIIIVDQSKRELRDTTIGDEFSDLPLRLIYQDEPGQCASRNEGLRVSTGDFILFIDDDDELEPTLIEDHLRTLSKFDADVSSGVAQEVGTDRLPAEQQFTRASDVFPTNNTLIRRAVLRDSGLFDLAFNRAPRADGELGMRVYLSGAFMVLDQSNSVLHHHAPEGGLRVHRARVVTYRMSREQLTKRSLPHISEIYLMARYFSKRQQQEALWLRAFGTLSARGQPGRRMLKVLVGTMMLPSTLKEISARKRQSLEWLTRYPQIATLEL